MAVTLVSTGVQFPDSTIQTTAANVALVRVARTSNTQLVSTNNANLIAITSGTFTQTFAACSSLGSGWYCYIQNSGTGDITLDPNGSETIDGLTSYIMYPSEVRLVQCDGSVLRTIVINSLNKTFTTTTTFTTPPGYKRFTGLMWGGGGGGASQNTYAMGAGGGACNPFDLDASTFSTTETFTVGSGGAKGGAGSSGSTGGTSSIGTKAYAYGGGGGQTGGNAAGGGGILSAGGNTGGLPTVPYWWSNSSSSVSITGAHPFGGATGAGNNTVGSIVGPMGMYGGGASQDYNNTACKDSVYGGGGGGSTNGASGAAGTSVYGGNGGASSGGVGSDGTVPGGGGGAGNNTGTGGNGARGEIRIWGVF